ncbi:MAG: hypothetical protein SFY95_11070 [Planctomycetota bacterium]|nr:hypothetical protein [Planctomycetota bacterium]
MPVGPADISKAQLLGEVVLEDHPCKACGYNLRGLKTGSSCPECGAAWSGTRRGAFAKDDRIIDAPTPYLRRLHASAWGLCATGGLFAASGILAWIAAQGWIRSSILAVALAVFSAVGWAVAVYVATAPRHSALYPLVRTTRELARVRLWARASQWCWAVWALLAWVTAELAERAAAAWAAANPGVIGAAPMHPGIAAMWALTGLVLLAAFAGLWALGLILADLSSWARNDDLADWLRWSTTGLVFGGALLVLSLAFSSFWLTRGLLAILAYFSALSVLVGIAMFPACLVRFAGTVGWAIRNQEHSREIDARRVARGKLGPSAPLPRACDECGYDLSGLPLGAVCPECGRRDLAYAGAPISGMVHSPPRPTEIVPVAEHEGPEARIVQRVDAFAKPVGPVDVPAHGVITKPRSKHEKPEETPPPPMTL